MDSNVVGWARYYPNGTIAGWALDRADYSRRVDLEIRIDGQRIGWGSADQSRPDLPEGDGSSGFVILVPLLFCDGEPHTAEVLIRQTQVPLKHNPGDLTFAITPEERLKLSIDSVFKDRIAGAAQAGKLYFPSNLHLCSVDGSSRVVLPTAWDMKPNIIPFEASISDEQLVMLFLSPQRIAFGGDLLLDGAIDVFGKVEFLWHSEGTASRIEMRPPVFVPGLAFQISTEPAAEEPVSVFFDAGVADFDISPAGGAEVTSTMLSLVGADQIYPISHFVARRPPLRNRTFDEWRGSRPVGWSIPDELAAMRGFATPSAASKGTATGTLILKVPRRHYGSPVLAQPINGDSIDQVEGPLQIGVMLRCSPAAEINLRLVDQSGRALLEQTFACDAAWSKHEWELNRSHDQLRPSAIEILVAVSSADEVSIEIVMVDLALGDSALFQLAAEATGQRNGENLVINGDLRQLLQTGLPRPSLGRFEAAPGWYVMNSQTASPTRVELVPSTFLDRGAGINGLLVSAAEVKRYCRIELRLRPKLRLSGNDYDFSFNISTGVRFAADRGFQRHWLFIERIMLIRRRSVDNPDADLVQDIARRVFVGENGEQINLSFSAPERQASEPEPEGEMFLVLEFNKPFTIIIDSPALRLSEPKPGEAKEALSFEDPQILVQAKSLKGCELWRSTSPVMVSFDEASNVAFAESNASAPKSAALRWSWTRHALGSIDIVICVYRAIDDTIECLNSLLFSTEVPYTVTIVDDSMEPETAERLDAAVHDKPWMKVIRNKENIGYTRSADLGVRNSSADWVVLLNSDTLVSSRWLERMLDCATSDPAIAMVGPVSNAASYQSVPQLHGNHGGWYVNPLPEGWSVARMAELVAKMSLREYPRVPLLNGFCTLMKRSVYLEVGGLDSATFPVGYGEENDLCLRVTNAGYSLAVADDVYIFHKKSASFGTARRSVLTKAGNDALKAKHASIDFRILGQQFSQDAALTRLREKIAKVYAAPDLAEETMREVASPGFAEGNAATLGDAQ